MASCDQHVDCVDVSDEMNCGYQLSQTQADMVYPAIVDFDGSGNPSLRPLADTCPLTHFLCPGHGFCLPVYVRCNEVSDCPGHEDEDGCDVFSCPGLYRCRASTVCAHSDHLCDGVPQCPHHDDERFCHLSCPQACRCYGMAAFCRQPFASQLRPDLRFAEARGTGMTPAQFAANALLIHLGLAACAISDIGNVSLPNLRSLDLTDNHLSAFRFSAIQGMANIAVLFLSGNPLQSIFQGALTKELSASKITTLDLSRVLRGQLSISHLVSLPSLKHLNLSQTELNRFDRDGFQLLTRLRSLDMRNIDMEQYPLMLLQNANKLQRLFTDSYKLCCPAVLPKRATLQCSAPQDPVSTCPDLLGTKFLRITTGTLGVVGVVTNTVSVALRVYTAVQSGAPRSPANVLLVQLSVSDWLLAGPLLLVFAGDAVWRGRYVLEDTAWRHSAPCRLAARLLSLSSTASSLLLVLLALHALTLLRRLSRVAFTSTAIYAACVLTWGLAAAASGLSVLSTQTQWGAASTHALCRPLCATHCPGAERIHVVSVAVVDTVVSLWLLAASLALRVRSASRSSVLREEACRGELRRVHCVRDMLLLSALCHAGSAWSSGSLGGLPGTVLTALTVVCSHLASALRPCAYLLTATLLQRRLDSSQRLRQILLARAKGLAANEGSKGQTA